MFVHFVICSTFLLKFVVSHIEFWKSCMRPLEALHENFYALNSNFDVPCTGCSSLLQMKGLRL